MQQLSASIKGVERERVRDDGGVKDTRTTHQETIKDLEKSLKELETNLTCVQSEKGEIFNKLKLTGQAQVIHGIDDSRVSGIKRDLSTKMAELLESENLLKTKINLVKTALSKTRLIEQQVQKIQLQQTLHKAESANVFAALEAVGGSLEEVEKSVTETEENLDLLRDIGSTYDASTSEAVDFTMDADKLVAAALSEGQTVFTTISAGDASGISMSEILEDERRKEEELKNLMSAIYGTAAATVVAPSHVSGASRYPRFPEAPTEAVFGLGSSTTTAPLASDAARVSLGKRSIEMPDTDAMERMMASMDMSPK